MPTVRALSRVPSFKTLVTDQGVVVQNTWYTALDGVNIELQGCLCKVTVADETVEVRITIDGVVYAGYGTVALAAAGNHTTGLSTVNLVATAAQIALIAASTVNVLSPNIGVAISGNSVKVEWRKTTAGGASHLITVAAYRQW